MKKLVLVFLLSTQCVVLAYSVRDLEKSIMTSDLEKTRSLIKKVEVTREERFRLLERAQEMVEYRRKRPFYAKSFKEAVAQAGMIGLPAMGSGILLGLNMIHNKLLGLYEMQHERVIRLIEVKKIIKKNAAVVDVLIKYWCGSKGPEDIMKFFDLFDTQLNINLAYLNKISQNKKRLLVVGVSAIIAGPILWLLKRSLAKKGLAEQERLYLNAVEIKQLMYTVAIKNMEE